MKRIILICSLFVFFASQADAQSKYLTRNAKVTFLSDAPLEKIEAINTQGTSIFVAPTGQFECAILMKAFEFEKALMMEHFNENYVESDKYPKAVFKGLITDMASVDLTKPGSYPVTFKGTMDLHGVKKEITGKGTMEVKDGKVRARSSFSLPLADYKIEIPALVKDKVAKEVNITVDATYDKM